MEGFGRAAELVPRLVPSPFHEVGTTTPESPRSNSPSRFSYTNEWLQLEGKSTHNSLKKSSRNLLSEKYWVRKNSYGLHANVCCHS